MPHVIVKLWLRKIRAAETQLAEAITKDVMKIFRYGEASVSVAFEEVEPEEWKDQVYKPHRSQLGQSLIKTRPQLIGRLTD
jgi:4-oxalocrotonate tautomerase